METIALQSDKFPKLSDFCPVYAQSEALDLIRSKVPLEQVIAGYHHAMAKRISTLVARAGLKKDFVIIGGLAKNPGITGIVGKYLEGKPGWLPNLNGILHSSQLSAQLSLRTLSIGGSNLTHQLRPQNELDRF